MRAFRLKRNLSQREGREGALVGERNSGLGGKLVRKGFHSSILLLYIHFVGTGKRKDACENNCQYAFYHSIWNYWLKNVHR